MPTLLEQTMIDTGVGPYAVQWWKEARKPPRWRQRTPAEVQAMRQLHAQGVSFEELARRFGCAASTAARICKGWSFSDLP